MTQQFGTIFDIQRFAVHDGPGIRSTVFFKGCSCRCVWCHNPESFSVRPQIELYPSRCIGCRKCSLVCPEQAQKIEGSFHWIDRDKCTGCGLCVQECPSNALVLKGRNVSVEEIMETLLADRAYYEESGGGVTLSGGEPVLQKAFAAGILSACKAEGIHTALQTAGNYPFSELEPLLPHLDMIMYDIKGFDPEIYSRYIRGSRDRILNNLKYLAKQFPGVLAVRTPCVGSVNDTDEEIEGIARLLAENGNIAYYQLLPYHGLGKAKYDALGEAFADYCYTPPPSRIEELERIASRYVPVFRQDRGIIQG